MKNECLTRTNIFNIWNYFFVDAYNNEKNYSIQDVPDSTSKYSVIYFSSNGILFPNTEPEFKSFLQTEKSFEWMKNKVENARKHIFVRDIFRQWYLEGINKDLNSTDKVKDFLESETRGTKIITIGVSSGGYAAVLFGILLNAEHILTFSGQFSLKEVLKESNGYYNPIVYKYRNDNAVNRYYDLTDLVAGSDIPIFYFTSKNDTDKFQLEIASGLKNVYTFLFTNDIHGVPFNLFDLGNIIKKSKTELVQLHDIYKGREINMHRFSIYVSGAMGTFFGFLKMKAHRKFIVTFFRRIGIV